MNNTLMHRLLVATFVVFVSACGDDGDGPSTPTANTHPIEASSLVPEKTAARSDGTLGGDLVALEVRMAEGLCECAPYAGICLAAVWDDDAIMCAREAYDAYASAEADSLACLEAALIDAIACNEAIACESDRPRCGQSYGEATQECPPPSTALAALLRACHGFP